MFAQYIYSSVDGMNRFHMVPYRSVGRLGLRICREEIARVDLSKRKSISSILYTMKAHSRPFPDAFAIERLPSRSRLGYCKGRNTCQALKAAFGKRQLTSRLLDRVRLFPSKGHGSSTCETALSLMEWRLKCRGIDTMTFLFHTFPLFDPSSQRHSC